MQKFKRLLFVLKRSCFLLYNLHDLHNLPLKLVPLKINAITS